MLSNKVIKAYSDPTWLYDLRGFFILTFAYRDTLQRQVAFFSRNMRNIHGEFAVGSGTLFAIIMLWRRFRKIPPPESIILSDYVPSMLASATLRFKNYSYIKTEVADLTKLPYPDNFFDSINVANSLHCIHNLDAALTEIFRTLKTEGTFGSNTLLYPNGNSFMDKLALKINVWGKKKGILYTAYTETDIADKIKQAGFEIADISRCGNACYILAKRP